MPKLPKPTTPRPVIVARISKEKIARGWSLEAQVDECRAWCRRNLSVDVPDEDVRIEDGVSGRKRKLAQRPGLFAAVEGAKAGEYTHIIFHAVDRGSRNLKIMCEVLDETAACGAVVVSVVDNQRSDTGSGKSFFQMVTMMAEWQADRTSEQIKAMQRARRASGLPNGPMAFGAMAGERGKPVPDTRPLGDADHTAHAGLLWACQQRAAGASYRDIVDLLNRAGYRTPRGNLFAEGTVKWMLHNQFYAGILSDGKPGDFDPIVPSDLWAQVQAMNARRKQQRHSAPKGAKAYSLGGGIVRCLACLARGESVAMQVYQSRRVVTWNGSLRCANYLRRKRCDQPSVPLRILEQQMEWVLHQLAMPAEDARTLIEAYVAHQTDQQQQDTATTALRRAEARLARQKRLYELGDWDEATYLAERASLLSEIEALRRAVTPLAATQLYDLSDYLRDMALAWRAADPAQKHQIAELLFQEIYVHDRQVVAVRPTAAFWPLFQVLAVTSEDEKLSNANYTGLDETLESALPGDAIRLHLSGTVASRRSSYLPDEQWQRLYAAYQTGTCYADLAQLFGISIRAVQYGIHDEKVRRGVPTRRADRPFPRKGGAR